MKKKKAMCQETNMSDERIKEKCQYPAKYIICFKCSPFETKQVCGMHLNTYIRLDGIKNLDIIKIR